MAVECGIVVIFPTYLQCDKRWGSYRYGTGGINGKQGTSICDSGCGPSSFAMMATVLPRPRGFSK